MCPSARYAVIPLGRVPMIGAGLGIPGLVIFALIMILGGGSGIPDIGNGLEGMGTGDYVSPNWKPASGATQRTPVNSVAAAQNRSTSAIDQRISSAKSSNAPECTSPACSGASFFST